MNQFHGIFGIFSESKILIFMDNILTIFCEIDLFDFNSFFGLDFFLTHYENYVNNENSRYFFCDKF